MKWRERHRPVNIAQRAVIVSAVFAGHVLFLALLCWPGAQPVAAEPGVSGDVVFASLLASIPDAKPAAASTAPVAVVHVQSLPQISPAQAIDAPKLSDVDTLAVAQLDLASAQGESDKPCDLTQSLRLAFAQSPAVRQGLDALPASERSVANAVMLWDGRWSDESMSGGGGLLRALFVKVLSSARPDCLTQVNRGPILFMLPDRQTTVVLAVGSGEWRWGSSRP